MDRGCAIAFALASSLAFPLSPALPVARPATRLPAPDAKFTAGTWAFPDAKPEKGSGGSKPSKDDKEPRKGALPKEKWDYYVKSG
jgi:hypothetical protein